MCQCLLLTAAKPLAFAGARRLLVVSRMRSGWLLAVVACALADAGRVLACGSVNIFYLVEAVSPSDGAVPAAPAGGRRVGLGA